MITNLFNQRTRRFGDDLWLIGVGVALMTMVALLGGCESPSKSRVTSPTLAAAKIAAASPSR